jgi:SOS response regulatory protein OraA/RecX
MIDPDPREFTDRTLHCAIDACAGSKWFSDRRFAEACAAELDRRMELEMNGPMVTHRGLHQMTTTP